VPAPIESQLIIHGSCKEHEVGVFPSKRQAKKEAALTWDGRPHTVIPTLRQCGKSLVVLNAARAKAGLEPVEL